MDNKYFILFSTCKVVKGYSRSIIYDLERHNFTFIQNNHYEILSKGPLLINHENNELIDFLIAQDLGFITEFPLNFPTIDLDYKPIEHLSNAVIEINNSLEWFKLFLKNSTTSSIRFVEIRFFNSDRALFYELMNLISSSNIEGVTLCVPEYKIIAEAIEEINEQLIELKKRWPELKTISIYNSPILQNYILEGNLYVILNKVSLANENCGKISVTNFNISVQSFVESISCNSCLNKKVSLTSSGKIKNCLSFKNDYGRIDQIDLEKIVHSEHFLKYNIPKDSIAVCKDCEFRYMCHDCRAYLPENEIHNKPKFCNYNPYSTLWEDQ